MTRLVLLLLCALIADGRGISTPREQTAVGVLRKLHLIRPDLIPYPMLVEVYA